MEIWEINTREDNHKWHTAASACGLALGKSEKPDFDLIEQFGQTR